MTRTHRVIKVGRYTYLQRTDRKLSTYVIKYTRYMCKNSSEFLVSSIIIISQYLGLIFALTRINKDVGYI